MWYLKIWDKTSDVMVRIALASLFIAGWSSKSNFDYNSPSKLFIATKPK